MKEACNCRRTKYRPSIANYISSYAKYIWRYFFPIADITKDNSGDDREAVPYRAKPISKIVIGLNDYKIDYADTEIDEIPTEPRGAGFGPRQSDTTATEEEQYSF